MMRQNLFEYIRIVGAIATQDIVDAIKNRTTLFNILFVFFMMAAYQWLLPVMYKDGDLVVYDAGGSRLAAALESSPQFGLRRVTSIQELKQEMGAEPRGQLGLVIPADFDQRLDAAVSNRTEEPTLGGYVMWSSRAAAGGLKVDLERQLSDLAGQPVHIKIEGAVQPQPDAMGPMRMVAVTFVLITIFMATFTVPHLMFEEKRTKTLDALLVSPASAGQVVMGKALAGSFYCLTAVAAIFTVNWAFVVHWGLATLVTVCGVLLAVGLGLLLGSFFERREQMMLWAMIPGQLLLGPVFISVFDVILPETIRTIMYWIPTVALTRLFRYAFAAAAGLGEILFYLAIVLLATAVVFGLVVWKVRRSDR